MQYEKEHLKSQQKSQRQIYGMNPRKFGEASYIKLRMLLAEDKWIIMM